MYFGTEEQRREHIQKKIDAKKAMLPYFPIIKKVVQQFDGKCYNCKLDKAIEEATKGIGAVNVYAGTERDNHYIYIRAYVDHESKYLFYMSKDQLKDGKRIDASKWFEYLNAEYGRTLQEIHQMESDLVTIDDTLKKVEMLKKQIEVLIDPLSWEVRDAYNIGRITI